MRTKSNGRYLIALVGEVEGVVNNSESMNNNKKRIVCVFGTRPEATKMAPVVQAIAEQEMLEGYVVVTGQHREQLDSAMSDLGIKADVDLNLMRKNQSPGELVSEVIAGAGSVFRELRPDLVIVHGDTGSTCGSALAAFWENVAVGHVEAGLRSGSLREPFPEEGNRRIVDTICDLLWAPTQGAAEHLAREGYSQDKIHVTGNTAIDTLRLYRDKARRNVVQELQNIPQAARVVLVTAHRRESFGDAFKQLCYGLRQIVEENEDVHIIYPVHLNPNVRKPVREILGDVSRIRLLEPLGYLQFLNVMDRCEFIITDSGGIQEEAPSLQKPVLVMRDRTERPEAMEAGTAILVGTNADRIASESRRLLTDTAHYKRMARDFNPYGDGYAAQRIVEGIKHYFGYPANLSTFSAKIAETI